MANPVSTSTRTAGGAAARPPAAGAAHWQVRLLGRVEASDGEQRIERFPSRAVAALLARLALAPERAHAREELAELLWPGAAPEVGRNRLRQALSTLKALLEPAGQPGRRVLDADRVHVRVLPGALGTDVREFESLLRAGRATEALALYAGELMPGHYADWIDEERNRLCGLHSRLLELQPAWSLPLATAADAPSSLPAAPAPAALGEPAAPRLPSYLTRLFGTELPAARLRGQVLGHRLVTLLGPGGAGKTRLAVEVAAALREPPGWAPRDEAAATAGFDRVGFVSLVSCFDATQLLEAVARALRLPATDSVAALVQALNGLRVLLVLDNLEQLVDAAAGTVAELLDGLPRLHVLATSRRRLGLDGEVLVAAEPLPLPAENATLAEAAANPAVALFVDRARSARSEFHLGERNHQAVVGLVRLLHGLPLAIELAASRARSFAPAELLGLLQAGAGPGRLALLERSGSRGAHDPRHASMAAVIAWSWELLDEEARQVLTALTLFPGHACSAAVAAVAGLPLARTAARLDDLAAHSLARTVPGESGRFEPYEPVREFAIGQATDPASGQQRLRQWLLAWARSLPQPLQRREVGAELASVQMALAAAETAPRDALELAVALRDFWDSNSLPASTLRSLQAAATALPARDALRADALELLAGLFFTAGFGDEARRLAERAVRAAGRHPSRRARALVRRAWIEIAAGRAADRAQPRHAELRAGLDEALALARTGGDRDVQARALLQMGIMAAHIHASAEGADVAGAEALFAQSQALWLALGDRRRANARLRNRAQCWAQLGRLDEAMAAYRHCEQAAVAEGDWLGEIDSLISMAELLSRRRDWAAALDANRRCLALCWRHWHRHALAYALWNPARVLARLRQPEAAIQLMAFASVFWTSLFGPLARDDERHVRRVRALVARQIGPTRTEQLWQRGLALDVASAVQLAGPQR
jgi:predicted ATPase